MLGPVQYVAFGDGWIPWLIRKQLKTAAQAYAPYIALSYAPAVVSWSVRKVVW